MKILLAILALAFTSFAQEIDRIVALVNRQPIVASEWEQQERFEAMSNEVPFRRFERSEEALERLIDRRLIIEQMNAAKVSRTSPDATAAQVTALRNQLNITSDAAWKAKLKQYGLLEADVADIVAEQADVLRFIEVKFRMAVHVNDDDIRRYYNETFLPEFARSGKAGTPPKVAAVRDSIESVLVQQRMNELFSTWLKTLRAQANIRRLTKDGPQ
jgi:hypothetical protein